MMASRNTVPQIPYFGTDLVAMEDPTSEDPGYCDMAENLAPGYGGGPCTEIDLVSCPSHPEQLISLSQSLLATLT